MMREVQINKNLKLREDGKLFNIRTGEEFIPKSTTGAGYLQTTVFGRHKKLVHQLVMEYFGEPKPGPKYEIDHKDRNILNNDIDNLRWVTRQGNANNRKTNLPVGQRKCDFEDPNEYYRQRQANRYSSHKEDCLSSVHKYNEAHREEINRKAREKYRKKKEGC